MTSEILASDGYGLVCIAQKLQDKFLIVASCDDQQVLGSMVGQTVSSTEWEQLTADLSLSNPKRDNDESQLQQEKSAKICQLIEEKAEVTFWSIDWGSESDTSELSEEVSKQPLDHTSESA